MASQAMAAEVLVPSSGLVSFSLKKVSVPILSPPIVVPSSQATTSTDKGPISSEEATIATESTRHQKQRMVESVGGLGPIVSFEVCLPILGDPYFRT